MFLALHRSLVDAPFFAADAPARAAPSSPSSAAAAEAAAAVDAAVEPAAAAAAEAGAAHHSTTSSSPSVVRLASGLAAAVATEPRTRAAEADAAPVLRAAVLLVGSVRNEAELAREYGFEMATGDPDEDDLAATVLDLYARGFADESGDASDEPAALLAMLRGSWALAVVAEKACSGGVGGGTGLHVIVARSVSAANGKKVRDADDDEMEDDDDDAESGDDGEEKEETPSPPLFWGITENSPDTLVVSSTPQPGLSPFPAGCFYESLPASSSSSSEEEGGGGSGGGGGKTTHCRIDQFSRRFASKATREVVVAPGGGGAAGIVRPLRYKTRSGKDLKVVE